MNGPDVPIHLPVTSPGKGGVQEEVKASQLLLQTNWRGSQAAACVMVTSRMVEPSSARGTKCSNQPSPPNPPVGAPLLDHGSWQALSWTNDAAHKDCCIQRISSRAASTTSVQGNWLTKFVSQLELTDRQTDINSCLQKGSLLYKPLIKHLKYKYQLKSVNTCQRKGKIKAVVNVCKHIKQRTCM